jgi:hypothetical protein
MSKISITGASTGTATFTLESPATSTNRTLTLPDNTGTIITQNSTPAFASTIGVGGATAAASGAGITFPASQSASSDANTLDDYEQGTFTPTAVGGTTAGTTTYVGQVGHYTKIGRQVTVTIYLQYSAMTGTGPLQIGGLPFSTMGSDYQGSFPAMIGGLNWSAGTMIMGYVPTSQSYLLLYGMADDANYTNQTCVNEAVDYYITCTYFAAD